MDADGAITIANNSKEKLTHLLVLHVHGKTGSYISVEALKPGEQKALKLDLERPTMPMDSLRGQVRASMAQGLRGEGLYAREAAAMVNTWDDSWFQEEGVRVLYVLPRAWTDQILPMQMDPQPKELVRVMVGRAELITPDTERKLTVDITQVRAGREEAREEIQAIVRSLGRFAPPVFEQALARTEAKPAERDQLLALLYDVRQ
jgi:hypothetical protein